MAARLRRRIRERGLAVSVLMSPDAARPLTGSPQFNREELASFERVIRAPRPGSYDPEQTEPAASP